jgi:hypothetical protein
LFRVSTLDLANLPRTPEGNVDFAQDFFGREAFLTVSGQLNIEAYCLALTKIYTFGPRTERNPARMEGGRPPRSTIRIKTGRAGLRRRKRVAVGGLS